MAQDPQVLIRGRDETAQAWASAQANASSAMDAIKGMIPGLASALSAAGLAAFTTQALDAADHMNDLSKATGVSVENLAGLQILARQTGTDLDGMAKAMSRMSVSIGKEPDKFRMLGITAHDTVGQLAQFADIFNQLPDIAQRNALAQAVFNRSWQELAPALSEGGAKIREVIEEGSKASGMTTELAKKSDELNDKWVMLFHTGSIGNAVLKAMIDPLMSITDQLVALNQAAVPATEKIARFFMISGEGAAHPAETIASIDEKLIALHKTADEFDKMGPLQKWFSDDDIAIVKTQISLLESERAGLVGLMEVRRQGAAQAFSGMQGGQSSADASKKAAHFLGTDKLDKDLVKLADEMSHEYTVAAIKQRSAAQEMLADWEEDMRKEQVEIRKLADDIGRTYVEASIKQQEANAEVMQAAVDEGQSTADSLRSTAELEELYYEQRLNNLKLYLDSKMMAEGQANAILARAQTQHEAKLGSISASSAEARRQFGEMNALQQANQFIGIISTLSAAGAQKNREMFEINKIASIANAVMYTYEGANKALGQGGMWGIAMASTIVALGLANVATIASTQFGSSGGAPSATGGAPGVTPVAVVPTVPQAGTGSSQTTIVNFTGTTDESKLIKRFIDALNEQSRDGARIITTS